MRDQTEGFTIVLPLATFDVGRVSFRTTVVPCPITVTGTAVGSGGVIAAGAPAAAAMRRRRRLGISWEMK